MKNLSTNNNAIDLPEFYAVRIKTGEWFLSKGGYNSRGISFVTNVKEAKIYCKQGPAKAIITWFSNKYPSNGVPDLIKFNVIGFDVIDQVERVKKNAIKREQREKAHVVKAAKTKLKAAEENFKQAQKQLEIAKGKFVT